MAKIIAITNQKGGVGKTTTAVNLTASLHALGKRVMLCDMDPQANATSGMGVDKTNSVSTVYDVLINGTSVSDTLLHTSYGDLLPSGNVLSGGGIELVSLSNREFVLKNALLAIAGSYDYILIDCPPSLEMLTLNSLCASDTVLIPVQCEYFALEGLSDLALTIRLVRRSLNPDLEIEGVLLTMADARTNFSAQVAGEIKRFFGKNVYGVTIPRNVRVSEAPSHGQPVVTYDPSSRGAVAYKEFAKEFLKRNGG